MKQIFYLIILLFFIPGCSIQGSGNFADSQVLKINSQIKIQKHLIANTSLEDQNISIMSSLIMTINNLKRLQKELELLNSDIAIIQNNLEKTKNGVNDNLTIDYLETLDGLTKKSMIFTKTLYNSTFIWDKYLSRQYQMKDNLNFSEKIDSKVFVDSIIEPVEVFGDNKNE